MFNVLVVKNNNHIMIFQNGKRLIISNGDELYSQLVNLSEEEIIQWYLEDRFNK